MNKMQTPHSGWESQIWVGQTQTQGPKEEQKKKQQKQGAGDSGLRLMDYISLGSTLLKGGNGAEMLSLLSGHVDMASMLKMLPQLLEGGQ